MQDMQKDNKSKIKDLKKDVNIIINKLYNEVAHKAFELDKYCIPIHGISHPQFENPMNLF